MLKRSVYEINASEYSEDYIEHNGEINPGIVPKSKCLLNECRFLRDSKSH